MALVAIVYPNTEGKVLVGEALVQEHGNDMVLDLYTNSIVRSCMRKIKAIRCINILILKPTAC